MDPYVLALSGSIATFASGVVGWLLKQNARLQTELKQERQQREQMQAQTVRHVLGTSAKLAQALHVLAEAIEKSKTR